MALTPEQFQEEKKKVEQYRSQGMSNEEITQKYKSDPDFLKKAHGTKLENGKVVQTLDQDDAMLPGNGQNTHTQQVKPSNQVTRDDEGIDTPREQLSVAERQAKMNDGRQMKGSTQWRAKFSPHTQSTYERILGRGGNREPKPMPMKDLSGLSAREIVDQYASGDIRDDEIKGLLESDPLKYEEVKNKKQQMSLYRQMNEEKSDYQARRNKIHSQYRDRVKDNYSFNSAERFDEKIKNNPKIQETKERIANAERELNTLYAGRSNLYNNIVKGSSFGSAVAMGQYSVALQNINQQIGAMENTVELEQSLYNDYIDLERQSLAYELDDKKQEMAYEFDMYGLEKDMNYEDYEMGVQSIGMELERLEKERAEIKEDQKIEQAKELMEQEQQSDKAFARFSVSQYFEGLPADQKADLIGMKPDQIQRILKSKRALEERDQTNWNITKDEDGVPFFYNSDGQVRRISGASGDLRYLAGNYPGQARAKNNNPAGITWNANFDNPRPGTTAYELIQAGIKFEKGTARPSNEGGHYVTFPTIEDGLAAQRIMYKKTYGNATVGTMLGKWVGTKNATEYAKSLSGSAGINMNSIVGDLSDGQLQALQLVQIKRESPGLYDILVKDQEEQDGYKDPAMISRPSEFKNETQAKSYVFASRMNESVPILNTLEQTYLMNEGSTRRGRTKKLMVNEQAPSIRKAPWYQQYQQAQRDFVNAVLRQESGAAISESEFESAKKQYFVQPGDDETTIRQKQKNRQTALDGMIDQSGQYEYFEKIKKAKASVAQYTEKPIVDAADPYNEYVNTSQANDALGLQ